MMATRMREQTEEQQSLDGRLEQLRAERVQLSKDLYSKVDQADKTDLGNRETARQDLEKLQQSMADYETFKVTIADLVTGLSTNLDQYTTYSQELQQYQGPLEKTAAFFGATAFANRQRIARLREGYPKRG